jgi:pyruvate/2-oxoglutarate dehydrogenase complex dihydrolipoamide dehydrogenase (E3) component
MGVPRVDLLVIGSGQGGGPLARAFAKTGRRAVLVEKVHAGGTCINEGCTPSKTMIASARVAHVGRNAADYGVMLGDPRADVGRVRSRKQAVVERFREGVERGLEAAGVELVRGHGRFVGERRVQVSESGGARTIHADVVVINTGLRPSIPRIDGLDGVSYLTSTSIMELATAPEHLLVLGGGYVGLEFAQMFRRFGSKVTLLHRGDHLLAREDADVAEEIGRIFRDDGIDIVLQATTSRVATVAGGVRIDFRVRSTEQATDSARSVTGTHLLVATGRTPNTDDLGLEAAGVETDERGYVRVDERLETSARGVYAVGDVKGGPAFTHVSYDDFRILRRNLLQGGDATTKDRLVPYTVFSDPQLGRVGMTEREARAARPNVRVATLPMSSVARAIEVNETRGFMKAVVDAESGRILGAAVLGLEGGETATLFEVAMMGDLPYTALRDGVFSHPTLAESLNNLFMAMDGDR